jgi:hypothetical protein
MSIIHRTTLEPSKVELLADWLPSRPWYQHGSGTPELTKAAGFRLDDPEGEVGIEFLVAEDSSGPEPISYLTPLTYRAAPLPGAADEALVGTMEHGVLGRRWAYDALHDPVGLAELLALLDGRAEPQAQGRNDTPDPAITVHPADRPAPPAAEFGTPVDRAATTELRTPDGAVLVLQRLLGTGHELPTAPAAFVTAPTALGPATLLAVLSR